MVEAVSRIQLAGTIQLQERSPSPWPSPPGEGNAALEKSSGSRLLQHKMQDARS
jgi:hypothetical protein